MAKPELGTKRICPTTGRKFYDLNKDPIISPYTGMIVPVAVVAASTRGARAEAKPSPVKAETPEAEAEEAEVEVVSLEDADEEETLTGKKGAATDPDDADVEDEEIPDADDEDTFLEEDEDENVDAAELIGDVEDDEES